MSNVTTQSLVLARLRDITEDAQLIFVKNGDWANTGTILAQDTSFDTIVKARYSFQSGYFTIEGVESPRNDKGFWMINNDEGDKIREFLAAYKKALT